MPITDFFFGYFIFALLFFGVGLQALLKDSTTPKTHCESWLALSIVFLFWPLVVVCACQELAIRELRTNRGDTADKQAERAIVNAIQSTPAKWN